MTPRKDDNADRARYISARLTADLDAAQRAL